LSGDQEKLAPSGGEVPEDRADCHPCPVGDLFGRVGRSLLGEDGFGRYGTHVRRSAVEFANSGADIAPVSFACTIWRLGVPSSLPCGYVRWHRRVLRRRHRRPHWSESRITSGAHPPATA
jgi:hypothetical protein